MIGKARALEKFLLQSTLEGRTAAKELSDVFEAASRQAILKRLSQVRGIGQGSNAPMRNPSMLIDRMVSDSERAYAQAEEALRKKPEMDQDTYEHGRRMFYDWLGE